LNFTTQTLAAIQNATPVVGDSIPILDNDSLAAPTGIFDSLPEGAIFTMDGRRYQITYQSTGDSVFPDVAVTYLNTPPVINAINETSSTIYEGDTLYGTVGFTDPDSTDSYTATIAWGDGTSTTYNIAAGLSGFRFNHAYLEEDGSPYTI